MMRIDGTIRDKQLEASLAEVAQYIGERLSGQQWARTDNVFRLADKTIYWKGVTVRLPNRYHSYTGSIAITVNRLERRSGSNTLPEKEYEIWIQNGLPPKWKETADAAIALAEKRATIATENAQKEAERERQRAEYAASLQAAIDAANLPTDCFEEWYGERRLAICKPHLQDGKLTVVVDRKARVTPEQAAQLFACTQDGKLRVDFYGQLTPEQWLAIRDIFKD